MNTENEIRAFVEDLISLKEKYNISAVTGIVFKDSQMAPFKIIGKGRLIAAMDEHFCNEFSKVILTLSANLSGSEGSVIDIKT